MDIIALSKNNQDAWDSFCLQSDSAWFRHTTRFLDCVLNCRFDGKSKNLSFMMREQNKIVAIVPLIMQTIHDEPENYEFAMFNNNDTPYPAFSNELREDKKNTITKIIFGEVDRLAKENKILYSRFSLEPLCSELLEGRQRFNPLTKFGYHETSLSTNIIDLRMPENELLMNIRKGHKADIKAASRDGYIVDIFDKDNISEEIFNIYKNLHFTAAGRQTRPIKSWDLMCSWIKDDYAFLLLERNKKNTEYISGAYVITSKQQAHYGSGATHPNLDKIRGIGHLAQWEAIKFLRRKGYLFYETGWNYAPVISQEVASQKELNISHFKSGFGGEVFPLFRGEKFYDQNYLRKKKNILIERYCKEYK